MPRTAALLPLALAAALHAAGPGVWELTSYSDFAKGRFTGVALTRDGRLMLAPRLSVLHNGGDTAIRAVVARPDGTLYAAASPKGRIYEIPPTGAARLLWTAPEPEIFALALDKSGALYAATSPHGKIYKLVNGAAAVFHDPQTPYVWSLACAPGGSLFAGTGPAGKVLRIGASGAAEVWYETGQAHVTALAFDAAGQLLAGSEPNGILYRIAAKDQAFVVYDAPLPEIRAILPASDGALYVAALGGGFTQKQAQAAPAPPAGAAPAGAVTTSITVTADAAKTQAGVDLKPRADAPKPAPSAEQPPAAAVIDLSGVEKTAVYRIGADASVETIWSSKDENVFDLALSGGDLLLATDLHGRIYRLSPDLKTALVAETREGETARLLQTPRGLIAASSNQGKLYLLTAASEATGAYESPVFDAGSAARWGRLDWRAEGGGQLSFRTRSGNAQRPDKTWSAWAAAPQGAVASPNARYIQWQAEFAGGAALDSVSLTYQAQNSRPIVRSVAVTPQWTAAAKPAAQQAASYSITVSESAEPASGPVTAAMQQSAGRAGSQHLLIAWQADDPDGDKLVYALYYRADDERAWKLVKNQITDASFLLESDLLADGRYFFKVEASDRLSNPAATAKQAELISAPVWVDTTPPRVTLAAPRRDGAAVEIDAEAADAASPLRRAEYSVDAGPWTAIEAKDGLIDSRAEQFVIRLTALSAGEHTVVLRVIDAAGNPGLAKVVLR